MNLNGEAVRVVSAFYRIQPDKTVVVYDELDVASGQIRMRIGGSAAGHNGITSVMRNTMHIESNFICHRW
jgi:PTH1 family peptidyl-tRNA hydrolase